jgi:TatD DNase family protein
VHATVGVHPLYKDSREPDADELVRLADHPRVVAIGETGLDYFYAKEQRDWQRDRFIEHIRAARRTGLPLIIHTRGAKEDTLALLREHGEGEVRGVLHCFTEDLDMAEQAMALGFYISISGIVTFRNAEALRDTVRQVPLERYVARVAECVAELKGIPVAELAALTRDNFYTLFNKAAR